jgi:glutaredoxin
MAQLAQSQVVKAYWQPGCTSCLRMKEFLTKHGVPFVSVNVLEDKNAFAELATLGVRSVPIIRRGDDWPMGRCCERSLASPAFLGAGRRCFRRLNWPRA